MHNLNKLAIPTGKPLRPLVTDSQELATWAVASYTMKLGSAQLHAHKTIAPAFGLDHHSEYFSHVY